MLWRKTAWIPGVAKSARGTLILLAVVLAFINLGAWVLVRQVIREQEDALARRLVSLGEFSIGFSSEDFFYPFALAYDSEADEVDFEQLQTYAKLPPMMEVQRMLANLVDSGELLAAQIYSPRGDLLLDRSGVSTKPVRPRAILDDWKHFQRAAAGHEATSLPAPRETSKRAYFPIRYRAGTVVAILRLEADRTYFLHLRKDFMRLQLLALLASLLVVALWLSSVRLINRSIAAERVADQADRLRALGTMTAGIAHEIRNPLGIITLTLEELRTCLPAIGDNHRRDDAGRLLDDMKEELVRMNDLADQFLELSRHAPHSATGPIDLGASAERTVAMFRKSIPPGRIEVSYTAPRHALRVRFSETRLRQVMLNLLRNAVQALEPKGGAVRIEVGETQGTATLLVSDDGPGMEPQVLARVFDPFFTTRSDGTGIGLPISKSIVESFGGTLVLESEPGRGTRARIALPLAAEAGL